MKDLLYVANAGEDTISIVSTEDLRETKRISLKGGLLGPRRLLLCGGMLYYINSYGSSVGRIELSTGRQSEVGVGAYPSGICKCGELLLVCCGETNNVYSIDCAAWRAEACANSGIFPVGIVAAKESALVSCMLSCEVLRIDEDLNILEKYTLSAMPLDAAQIDDMVFISALETDGSGALYRYNAQGKLTGRKECCAAGPPVSHIGTESRRGAPLGQRREHHRLRHARGGADAAHGGDARRRRFRRRADLCQLYARRLRGRFAQQRGAHRAYQRGTRTARPGARRRNAHGHARQVIESAVSEPSVCR